MQTKFDVQNSRDFVKELSEILRGKVGASNLSTTGSNAGAPAQTSKSGEAANTSNSIAFIQEALTLVSEAQIQNERLTFGLERASSEIELLREERTHLNEALSAATQQVTETLAKFKSSEEEKIKIIAERDAFSSKLAENEKLAQETAESNKQATDHLKGEMEKLSSEIARLQNELEEAKKALSAAEEKINSLNAEKLGANTAAKGEVESEKTAELTIDNVMDKSYLASEEDNLMKEYFKLVEAANKNAGTAQRELMSFIKKHGRNIGLV